MAKAKLSRRRRAEEAPSASADKWDQGAEGIANQDGLILEERGHLDHETGKLVNPNNVRGMRRETWIDRYLRKEKLTVGQAMAARWLRDASEGRGNQDPLASLSGPVDGGAYLDDPMAAAMDRRRLFLQVWRQLPMASRPVIQRVVIEDRPIRSLCKSGQQELRHLQRLQDGLSFVRDLLDRRR